MKRMENSIMSRTILFLAFSLVNIIILLIIINHYYSYTVPIPSNNNFIVTVTPTPVEKPPIHKTPVLDIGNYERISIIEEKVVFEITGYVTDHNGHPLESTRITVKENESITKTRSDTNGYYRVVLSQPGNYTIHAIPPGDYLEGRKEISLTKKKSTITQNFTLRYAPLSIRGKVIDNETSEPISNAYVQVSPVEGRAKAAQTYVEGYTNDDGTFHLNRLAQGYFTIKVVRDGYIPFVPFLRYGMYENHQYNQIQINEKTQHNELLVKMLPAGAALIHVKSPNGEPVTNAKVKVQSSQLPVLEDFPFISETNEQGEVLFRCLPFAPTSVIASKLPFGMSISEEFQPGPQKEPKVIDIVMTEAGSLQGRVINQHNKPVEGVELYVRYIDPKRHNLATMISDTVKSNGDGEFIIKGLGAGTQHLFTTEFQKVISIKPTRFFTLKQGENITDIEVVVAKFDFHQSFSGRIIDPEGQPVEEATVIIAISGIKANVKDEIAEVKESYGNGGMYGGGMSMFGGYGMMVSKSKDTPEGFQPEYILLPGTTDEFGNFMFEDLPEGDQVKILVHRRGFETTEQYVSMNETDVTIVMKPNLQLRGTVTDAMTGEPIQGAKISPMRKSASPVSSGIVFSGNDGTYRIEDAKYLHTLNLQAEKDGYAIYNSEKIEINPEASIHIVDIAMQKGHEFKAKIVDPNNNPVQGAYVERTIHLTDLYMLGQKVMMNQTDELTISNDDGIIVLNSFSSDGGEIVIVHPEYADRLFSVEKHHLNGQTVTIPLQLGGTIHGIVLDTQDNPKKQNRVFADHFDKQICRALSMTDENGFYEIKHLPAGTYRVYSIDSQVVTIKDRETVEVNLGGSDGSIVCGTVYNNGQPFANVRVNLYKQNYYSAYSRHEVKSEEDGTFIFRAIPPGNYRMQFVHWMDIEDHSTPKAIYGMTHIEIDEKGQTYTVDLHAENYVLEGVVKDESTGETLSEVQIIPYMEGSLYDPKEYTIEQHGYSNDQGKFILHLYQAGLYQFIVQKEGYENKVISVNFSQSTKNQSKQIEINLQKAETELQLYLFHDGKPLETNIQYSFQVWVIQNGIRHYVMARPSTDKKGVYIVKGPHEGIFNLSLTIYDNDKTLIGCVENIDIQKGQSSSIIVNLYETNSFLILLQPSDQCDISSVFAQALFPDLPHLNLLYFGGLPVNNNHINMLVPKGNPLLRLSIPEYKPVEFYPNDGVIPGENEKRLIVNVENL
jgi:protocatechuate 3,4-dioxygenase beta subunit